MSGTQDREFERLLVDASFAEMATDVAYQRLAEQIMAEFAYADWEALCIGEAEFHGHTNKEGNEDA